MDQNQKYKGVSKPPICPFYHRAKSHYDRDLMVLAQAAQVWKCLQDPKGEIRKPTGQNQKANSPKQ